MKNTTHFHSGDARFCGTDETARQFSFKYYEVTCNACLSGVNPKCNLCGKEMMLQEALDDDDAALQIEVGSSYPQYACFCNSGNYINADYVPLAHAPANWRP